MTVTETFRHLQRLTDAKLIEKKVDGTYTITSLGNLATGFLRGFNFVLKNGGYFLEHDVSSLPYEFVSRLGDYSSFLILVRAFCSSRFQFLNDY